MTRWLRLIGGIVAGYTAIVILSTGTTAVLRSLLEVARAEDPPAAYLVFDLFYSLVYATAGGWVAVRIGASAWSSYVLAGLFLVLGAWTVLAGLDQTHPLVYQLRRRRTDTARRTGGWKARGQESHGRWSKI